MPSKEFYTPTDVEPLRMENDLLALQAQVLRARWEGSAEALERLRQERDARKEEVEHLRGVIQSDRAGIAEKAVLERERYDELRRAQRDLVWLLRRLSRPPLGWLFARRKGYRKLQEQWLRED